MIVLVIDNDVLVKGACYDLLERMASVEVTKGSECGFLGVAKFVVPKTIAKQELLSHPVHSVIDRFNRFAASASTLEPTEAETELAARLEWHAQQLGLALDAGESQLAAILIERGVPFLLTGDKRAISALERLIDHGFEPISGRVRSLEQAIQRILEQDGIDVVRSAICTERLVDKTLSICFSCSSPEIDDAHVLEGLQSYVTALRASAGRILAT